MLTKTEPALEKQRRILEVEGLLQSGKPASLVSSTGKRVELPNDLQSLLREAVALMSEGLAVRLVGGNQVVTTQRAAEILGMSRPHLVKLLEDGAMPFHLVGNRRRLYLNDVLAFQKKRHRQRRSVLDRLARDAYEAGLYENTGMPEGGSDE